MILPRLKPRPWTKTALALIAAVAALAAAHALPSEARAAHYTYGVTVEKSPSEGGTVTGEAYVGYYEGQPPAVDGLDCGTDCTGTFAHVETCESDLGYENCYDGDSGVLTATPAPGRAFKGWDGCPRPSGNQCYVWSEGGDLTVTARFGPAECSDGSDNDEDEKVDHPADPDCEAESDNSESPVEQEPNNTRAEADARSLRITGDGRVAGAIDTSFADRDFFRIEVSETRELELETRDEWGTGCAPGVDTVVHLYNSAEGRDGDAELQSDDDGGLASCSLFKRTVTPGTYYVSVGGAAPGYRLLATFGAPDPNSPDTGTPSTDITAGPSGLTNDPTPTFEFAGSDDRSADSNLLFSYKLDYGEWSEYSSARSVTFGDSAALSQGGHTFYVRAKDEAGNVDQTEAVGGFTLDSEPPNTTITSGPSYTVRSTSASFGFSSSESGSTFECRRDGGEWSSCSSPKDYSSLSQGDHTFEVAAIDAAGNRDATPDTRSWKIDTVAPTVTAVSPSSGATGVTTTANVLATFSEATRATTVTKTTVKLVRKGTTTPLTATVTYDSTLNRAQLDPSSSLIRGATYIATVTTGVEDLAGNPMASNKSWSFTVRR